MAPAPDHASAPAIPAALSYKANVSNALSERAYRSAGAASVEPAYELAHQSDVELMRSKYCIRHELGICLKTPAGKAVKGPLYLLNNGRRLELVFDCASCEMAVRDFTSQESQK